MVVPAPTELLLSVTVTTATAALLLVAAGAAEVDEDEVLCVVDEAELEEVEEDADEDEDDAEDLEDTADELDEDDWLAELDDAMFVDEDVPATLRGSENAVAEPDAVEDDELDEIQLESPSAT